MIKCEIEHVKPDDCGAYKVVIDNNNGKNESLCAVAVTRKKKCVYMSRTIKLNIKLFFS